MHSRRARGFSMIEAAVVMVILGLLMTSALPNISSWLRNAKLRNQAESMLTGLQQARSEAVRRNRAVTFWMVNLPTASSMDNTCTTSSSGTSWVISLSDPSSHCGDAPSLTTDPKIVATRVGADGGTGVSINGYQADASTAASSVAFNGFGQVTGTGSLGVIVISYASSKTSDRPLHIEVSSSGQSRLCDPAVSDTTDPRHCIADGTSQYK